MNRFPGIKAMVDRAWEEERGCREHKRSLAIDYASGGTRTFRTEELRGTRFVPARISGLASVAFKLIVNDRHLYRVLKEYVQYYNERRPHQGLGQQCPVPLARGPGHGPIARREVLGGLIHDYDRQAA
jgi:hypothetical protein